MKKGIIAIFVLLVLGGGAYWYLGGDLGFAQGRLMSFKCNAYLSAESPSGTKVVNPNDIILKFEVEAKGQECNVKPGKEFARVLIKAEGVIDATGDGDTVVLLNESSADRITGTINVRSEDRALISFFAPKGGLTISPSSTTTFGLQVDTTRLIDESPTRDDLITPIVQLGKSRITGNTLVY